MNIFYFSQKFFDFKNGKLCLICFKLLVQLEIAITCGDLNVYKKGIVIVCGQPFFTIVCIKMVSCHKIWILFCIVFVAVFSAFKTYGINSDLTNYQWFETILRSVRFFGAYTPCFRCMVSSYQISAIQQYILLDLFTVFFLSLYYFYTNL